MPEGKAPAPADDSANGSAAQLKPVPKADPVYGFQVYWMACRRARHQRQPTTRPTARPPSSSLRSKRTLFGVFNCHNRATMARPMAGAVLASNSANSKAAELKPVPKADPV